MKAKLILTYEADVSENGAVTALRYICRNKFYDLCEVFGVMEGLPDQVIVRIGDNSQNEGE